MVNKILGKLAGLTPQMLTLLMAVVGGIYYFNFFNDGSSVEVEIQGLQGQLATEKGKEKETDAAIKELEQMRITVGALAEQFKQVRNELPAEVNMADILRELDRVAKTSGVEVSSKEPKKSVGYGYYEEIPVHISLEGTYSEILIFLFNTTSTERLMKAKNFRMVRPTDTGWLPPGTVRDNRLRFEGEIVSFRFLGDKAEANAAAGAAAPGSAGGGEQ